MHASQAVAPGFDAADYFGYPRRQYNRLREMEAFLRRVGRAGSRAQRPGAAAPLSLGRDEPVRPPGRRPRAARAGRLLPRLPDDRGAGRGARARRRGPRPRRPSSRRRRTRRGGYRPRRQVKVAGHSGLQVTRSSDRGARLCDLRLCDFYSLPHAEPRKHRSQHLLHIHRPEQLVERQGRLAHVVGRQHRVATGRRDEGAPRPDASGALSRAVAVSLAGECRLQIGRERSGRRRSARPPLGADRPVPRPVTTETASAPSPGPFARSALVRTTRVRPGRRRSRPRPRRASRPASTQSSTRSAAAR